MVSPLVLRVAISESRQGSSSPYSRGRFPTRRPPGQQLNGSRTALLGNCPSCLGRTCAPVWIDVRGAVQVHLACQLQLTIITAGGKVVNGVLLKLRRLR